MTAKILCVDDDENILAGFQRNLRKQFSIETATSGQRGLEVLESNSNDFGVVLADMQMPGMNGVEFLKQIEVRWPELIRIMLTGNADQKTAVDALNESHVFRFLNKPCEPELLASTLHAALHQYEIATRERLLLEQTVNGAIKALVDILSLVDPKSFGRVQTAQQYVKILGQSMGLSNLWEIEAAAMLSRVGRLALPPQVLLKVRANMVLTALEQQKLERVPEISRNLVANIPRLEQVAQIIYYYQKRFDGSGFPNDRISGNNIPLGSRLLKLVSDMLDLEEMGTSRATALQQMGSRSGWYDPKVMDAAFSYFGGNSPAGDPKARASLGIGLKDLRVGDTLAADLTARDGTTLLACGQVLTQASWEWLLSVSETGGVHEPILIAKDA